MDTPATAPILRAFTEMPDPRRNNCRHKLTDLLTIALFAVICGADNWVAVVAYARAKRDWFQTFLELPHGLPSHDTFNDLFARLNPEAFERCFAAWTKSLVELSAGTLVAIDGKSLRRSFEHAWDKSGMAHLVSAFVQNNRLAFAQVKTEGKGQELSAIEQILSLLELNGAVVTIDALGTQKTVARQILDAGGQYVLQVKDNQPQLLAKLQATLDDALLDGFAKLRHDWFEETEAGHGRIETRRLGVCWDVKLLGELGRQWPGLRAMIVVERRRELAGKDGRPKVSCERHYYISSLDRRTRAKRLAGCVRGHWSVENNLHWQLDVSFGEDQRRLRQGHGAENFSRLCRIALNLLKRETTQKTGIAIKRQTCGWKNECLLKVVMA